MSRTRKLHHALIVAAGGTVCVIGAPPVFGQPFNPVEPLDAVPLDQLLPSFRDACLLLASVAAIAAAMVVLAAAGAA